MSWSPSQAKIGVVIYNFDAGQAPELSLEVGDVVHISEECLGHGWYRGYRVHQKEKLGIFPCSFVHLKAATAGDETGSGAEEPVCEEVTDVLRVWGDMLKEAFSNLQEGVVQKLSSSMTLLVKWRRDILHSSMRSDQQLRLKMKITSMIDKVNSQLGMDMVPRNANYDPVDVDNISVLELYNIHRKPQANEDKRSSPRFIHLYAQVSSASCQVNGEDTDMYFALYNASTQAFVSERVLVRFGSDGTNRSLQKDKKPALSWLFTELEPSLLEQVSDLYIVCHVVRLGRVDLSVKKPTSSIFKRPVGCVVLPLAKLRAVVDEPGSLVQVSSYMCPVSDEKDFSMLHDMVIRRAAKPSDSKGSILLNLSLLYGELAWALESHHELISKETPTVRKLGLGSYALPGKVRNDIFITLERGEFEKGSKTSAKNVEVSMILMNSAGETMDVILSAASSSLASEVQSVVLYHNNSPRWGETFRLNIPQMQIADAILVFNIRHCSSTSDSRASDKQSVFAYLKLVKKDGTTIPDGLTDLCVYRFSPDCTKPSVFLKSPSTVQDLSSTTMAASPLVLSRKESFAVRVGVCSTKLTQDSRLLALLQWRMHQDQLVDVLEGVMNLEGREVCLFMQDAFDALFNILDIDNKLCTQLVFNALVHFLGFLLQPKYEQFVDTLQTYIDKHFSGAMAYKKLLTGLRGYIEKANRPELQDALLHTMETFHFILKIIVQSRQLHARATRISSADTSFKESMEKTIQSLITVIKSSDEKLRSVQVAALTGLGKSVEILRSVFQSHELAEILAVALDAISAEDHDHPLIRHKLSLMRILTNGPLFAVPDARPALLSVILSDLGTYIVSETHLDAVIGILGSVVNRLENKECAVTCQDKKMLSSILPKLVPMVAYMTKGVKNTEEFFVALCSLLGILRLMDGDIIAELMATIGNTEPFIKMLFTVFRHLLVSKVFEKTWTAIRLIQHNVILVSISLLADTLRPMDGTPFNVDLMKMYFLLTSQFITQPALQLESLHPIKAAKLEAQFGDMRCVMATELVVMWSVIGDGRGVFVPSLVDSLLRATVVKQEEVRRAILPIFIDMLELDYKANKSIKKVCAELFHTLDPVVSKGGGDYEFLTILEEIWVSKATTSSTIPEKLGSQICSLVERLVRLGSILFDYRSLGERDVTSTDRRQRMLVLFNLVCFYKEHGPAKLLETTLYRLAQLHIKENSWPEAAFTLLQIAESLDFNGKTLLDGALVFTRQTERERKEALLQSAVKYFGQGKAFECGIEQCDNLIQWYRHQIFDYPKLRSILEVQASYFGNIVDELRPAREYFRVGFFGQGFPKYLRNKAFVFRGQEYEKLSSFQDRVLLDHNNVELMKTNQLPGEEVTGSKKRYLQICTVRPCPVVMEKLESGDVHEHIREHYQVNNVSRFEYSRPYHKGPKDKENEFKSLWLERICVTIAFPLPGVLQWAEVVNTAVGTTILSLVSNHRACIAGINLRHTLMYVLQST